MNQHGYKRTRWTHASAVPWTGRPGITTAGLAAPAKADDRPFLLGLEEHCATPELQRHNNIRLPKGVPCLDINAAGAGRVFDMEAAVIDLQVVSALTPGAQNLPGSEGIA